MHIYSATIEFNCSVCGRDTEDRIFGDFKDAKQIACGECYSTFIYSNGEWIEEKDEPDSTTE